MPELKASLPRNLSGKEEDANLWLLTMKVYFTMNSSLYEEKNKILAFLNKMDTGHGKSFAKGWLMKCSSPTKIRPSTKLKPTSLRNSFHPIALLKLNMH